MTTPTVTDHPWLLFCDVETGGLPTPVREPASIALDFPVLSFAFHLWDPARGIVASTGELFTDADDSKGMDPFCVKMHTENGLLSRRRSGEHALLGFETIDDQVCRLLDVHLDEEASVMMAGQSPGALDRPVVNALLPNLSRRLGHRTLDVSSLRLPARAVGVDLEGQARAAGAVYDHTADSDAAFTVAMYEAFLTQVAGVELPVRPA